MKKILFVAALGLVFAACSGKSDAASSESATQVAEETVSTAGAPEAAMEVKIDTVGYTTTASGLWGLVTAAAVLILADIL